MLQRHLLTIAGTAAGVSVLAAGAITGPGSQVGTLITTATSVASAALLPVGDADPPPAPTPAPTPPIRHDIPVEAADPDAQQAPNKDTGVANRHLVLVPAEPAQRRKRLFLFVGGTNNAESLTQEVVRVGAAHGYHAISIAYPNADAVAMLCLGALDDECTAKVREEIITGVDLTPLVTVAPADAIETRLRKLLEHLKATYPNEGWGSFLSQGAVDWSLVSALGHSQGAGHVAYLAKRHALLRAAMVSGVADLTALGRPAPWLARTSATPLDRQYGFTHVADPVVPLPVAEASWYAIGLQAFGAAQSTDNRGPDYGGSHKLTTALLPQGGINPHLSMMQDKSMPRNADGSPAYAPVWAHIALP